MNLFVLWEQDYIVMTWRPRRCIDKVRAIFFNMYVTLSGYLAFRLYFYSHFWLCCVNYEFREVHTILIFRPGSPRSFLLRRARDARRGMGKTMAYNMGRKYCRILIVVHNVLGAQLKYNLQCGTWKRGVLLLTTIIRLFRLLAFLAGVESETSVCFLYPVIVYVNKYINTLLVDVNL